MTGDEAFALNAYQYTWWNYRVQIISQVNHLSADERTEFDAIARTSYRDMPLSSLWYRSEKPRLTNTAAIRYVDNLLAQSD